MQELLHSRRIRFTLKATRSSILKQMPAVGDLNRFRQGTGDCAAIAAVAVEGDNLDTGTRTETLFHSGGLAVREKVDHLPPFKIADQRALALSLSP